jgi:tRNA (guanine37-N1)-methyltransferase
VDVDVITIFPEMFRAVLAEGMLRVAREKGMLRVQVHDLREYTDDNHRSVDDRPYGGGPGMVLKCGPVFRAIESVCGENYRGRRVLMSPQGRTLTHGIASMLAKEERLLVLCGRYEGYDERIREAFEWDEISIGDYVTSGGELPALVMLEAVTRLMPGVLGDGRSAEEDSFVSGMLDHPHYTRPEEFRGMRVPKVLLGGHHKEIDKWRKAERERRTAERRPDLRK